VKRTAIKTAHAIAPALYRQSIRTHTNPQFDPPNIPGVGPVNSYHTWKYQMGLNARFVDKISTESTNHIVS
jgi:hypothetical protein